LGSGACTTDACKRKGSRLTVVWRTEPSSNGGPSSTGTFTSDGHDDTNSNLILTRPGSDCVQVYTVTSGSLMGNQPGKLPTGQYDTTRELIAIGVVLLVIMAGVCVICRHRTDSRDPACGCLRGRSTTAYEDGAAGAGAPGGWTGAGTGTHGATDHGLRRALINSSAAANGYADSDEEPIFARLRRPLSLSASTTSPEATDPLSAAAARLEQTQHSHAQGKQPQKTKAKQRPRKPPARHGGSGLHAVFDDESSDDDGIFGHRGAPRGAAAAVDDSVGVLVLERMVCVFVCFGPSCLCSTI
jgi:hypothetical protein